MDFVDTNIFVYSFLVKQAPEKHRIALDLLQDTSLATSSQVINELSIALLKKGQTPHPELRRIVNDLYSTYTIIDQTSKDILAAFDLREEYKLSFWDSLVVATALRADAKKLYSEDMQDGLVVRKKLTITNPFHRSK